MIVDCSSRALPKHLVWTVERRSRFVQVGVQYPDRPSGWAPFLPLVSSQTLILISSNGLTLSPHSSIPFSAWPRGRCAYSPSCTHLVVLAGIELWLFGPTSQLSINWCRDFRAYWALSYLHLTLCKESASTTSLPNAFHLLTTLSLKKFFLTSLWLMWVLSFHLCPLVRVPPALNNLSLSTLLIPLRIL